MTLVQRIVALERSPAADRRRLLLMIVGDAEAMDLAVRTLVDRHARFQGLPPEAAERLRRSDPLQRALREAYAARVETLKASESRRAGVGERYGRCRHQLSPLGLDHPEVVS